MAAVAQGPHFGHGSNLVDGPAPMVDDENVAFVGLVNNIRPLLARAPGIHEHDRFEIIRIIQNMATQCDRGLFCRAVIESCKQELGHDDDFQHLVLYYLLPLEYYLATVINKYLSKNDLTHATNVICYLDSSTIRQIDGIYPSLFEKPLEDDIETFTFGEHREMLVNYIRKASAPERNDLRAEMLRDECREEILTFLNKNYKETVKRPRMAIANCIFDLRVEHLREVADAYREKYGSPLEKDLTLANYGHVGYALKSKIEYAKNRPGCLAEKLCEAMIDRYTRAMRDIDHIDRETIVRVITTVAEIDLMRMKEEYRQKSGRALEDDISVAFADRQDCWQLILLILNPKLMNDDAVALRAED